MDGWTVEHQTCHLIEDSASKSLRLSAMLMDSSIRGSFFCGDRSRCNTRKQPIRKTSETALSVPFVFRRPAPADSACSPAASCEGPEPPSWPVPPAAPPALSWRHTIMQQHLELKLRDLFTCRACACVRVWCCMKCAFGPFSNVHFDFQCPFFFTQDTFSILSHVIVVNGGVVLVITAEQRKKSVQSILMIHVRLNSNVTQRR